MSFPTVTPEELRAGQLLTGLTMAALLLSGLVPRFSYQIRIATLAIYLGGIVAFAVWFLVR